MKRFAAAVLAAVMCAGVLCACGEKDSDKTGSAPAKGNASAFNLDESHLKSVLACSWVNQNDLDETIKFNGDLSFTHSAGGESHDGKAELNEQSGMLKLVYDDGAFPEKSYVWVDSLSNANANTWYVDGGTFSFGGKSFIKDMAP